MKRNSRRLTAFVLAAAMMAQGAVSAAPALAADGGSRTLAAQPASGQLTLTLADGETAILTAT